MTVIIQILVTKLIEALCKYAEKKFTQIRSGHDKKAYVLNKVEEVFDIDDEDAQAIKSEVMTFAEDKVDDVVARVINKK